MAGTQHDPAPGYRFALTRSGALLAHSVPARERHRWQGLNDTLIAACATLGAFLPAPMLAGFGWTMTNLLMLPLCMIGMVLCLHRQQISDSPSRQPRPRL